MVVVYVEGGGDTTAQRSPLRLAVGKFLAKALPHGRKPRVEAWGGRRKTYDKFCQGVVGEPEAFHVLLVDSESAVRTMTRWGHVATREGDGWTRHPGIGEDNLHFMAQAMESWLCADPAGLAKYFGAGFKAEKLPQRENLEEESKADLLAKLVGATRDSKQGEYRKGPHLELLGFIRPEAVSQRCPSAKHFLAIVAAKR